MMLRISLTFGLSLAAAAPLLAQTDYYNTDLGRPVRIEDASPVEHYAFELQVAPLRLEREAGGVYRWELEPELAYGILPRTHLEVGFPILATDAGDRTARRGLGGITLSAFHNLNVETRTLPALALAADVALPVGALAPENTYGTVKGIATRSFGFGRVHANGAFTFGPDAAGDASSDEVSRWMAGAAVDHAFPLRSILATADLFAEQPLDGGEALAWTIEAGLRYQTSPQFNLDLGVGRRFAGGSQGWLFTFGLAHAFGVRGLMPGR
jgi:hypothetical protein